jgi:MoaA/NifB/PqqE/SkfB family radical SAM enzyme
MAIKLSGLHFLLSYQCTLECDHCFTWGSPNQSGTMTITQVRRILQQAVDLGTITEIYFEGGEPFLYYGLLLQAAREAAGLGFEVGIVSNAYWATSEEDARVNLKPFAGLVRSLSVSSDLFHWDEAASQQSQHAAQAARALGIPLGIISIAQPEDRRAASSKGKLVSGESKVMYRGRAAVKLAGSAEQLPWQQFTTCPHEDLRDPGRVHVDPFGNLHLCQGLVMGNCFQASLGEICTRYDPEAHPIAAALLSGGPTELVRRYGLPHAENYADACHLCYAARLALRSSFPQNLGPDQMYGLMGRENS